MLVLTRKPNESVIMDNEVRLKIIEIRGNQVRIGVEAPVHISVHREEVQQRIGGKLSKDSEESFFNI